MQVQRIILHQDENGQLRVVDMATEREVKRMLESQVGQTDDGGTMVVHVSAKKFELINRRFLRNHASLFTWDWSLLKEYL